MPEIERRLGTFRDGANAAGNHSILRTGSSGSPRPPAAVKTEFALRVLDRDMPRTERALIRIGSQANNVRRACSEQDDGDNWRPETAASTSRHRAPAPQDLSMGTGYAGPNSM